MATSKNRLVLILAGAIAGLVWLGVAVNDSRAGEGMWLPEQLPAMATALTEAGLELDPSVLADVEAAPLGAIISLGGCSASFVSANGLVATNHHCASGAMQHNSTAEENLQETGFVASSQAEERWAGPGSRVYITEAVTDVTAQVLGDVVADMSDQERFTAIDDAEKRLTNECEEPGGLRCRVASFYGGAEYRLIRQREIEDVRLVFAPPFSIGAFGGEEDNWMWPRHCGDFSLFRAYVGPDGNPAPFSEDNVPYQPAHHLTVNPEGVSEGDFVMVAGYPGRTYRHRTALELQAEAEVLTPLRIGIMTEVQDMISQIMSSDEESAVRLQPLHFGLGNYIKYSQGNADGFESANMVSRAQERDVALRAWLQETPERESWALAVAEIDDVITRWFGNTQQDMALSWLIRGPDALQVAAQMYQLSVEREKPDEERLARFQERNWDRMHESLLRQDSSYVEAADRAMFTYFLDMAAELDDDQRIEAVDTLLAAHDGDSVAATAYIWSNTDLTEEEPRHALFDMTRAEFEASSDPLIQLAVALYPLTEEIRQFDEDISGALARLRPSVVQAQQAFSGAAFYPDANSTLRVTYGHVQGYDGPDGIRYVPFTTLRGITAKDTGEEPYDSPQLLLDGIAANDLGDLAVESLGSIPVNFLSNVDTTGGNSGSVTMNARGEFVGLLFDGNYEAMTADWVYNADNTRSIHVDVRYMLWVMGLYGADELVNEMLE